MIDAHSACTSDDDCVTIAFSASCFDSCDRAVAKSGEADVKAARERVDAGVCATYRARGCKLIVPPCVPPERARCESGRCT